MDEKQRNGNNLVETHEEATTIGGADPAVAQNLDHLSERLHLRIQVVRRARSSPAVVYHGAPLGAHAVYAARVTTSLRSIILYLVSSLITSISSINRFRFFLTPHSP